ncbi:hypothetical protein PAHAL_2G356800 [Panicum hallii]|uniref:Uncharacterized protein n=1 Tax=Panicum hallii TaxID=206008 RepID=A0A2S3H214_9POAL|nr:uncharacterized protein LOC112882392 isoform X1 [Panicum hallii]PAN13678.1 hypothetical protein PAHAL_2G356800 [Panicum hallii]
MPAGDNPHSISEKKAALRESPKQSKIVVNEQPRTSFSKDKVAATVSLKRQQPYGPLSPSNHHTLGNPGANGHLVYVRRRPDTDQSKGGTSARAESVSSMSTKKPIAGGLQSQEQSLKHQDNVSHTQFAPRFSSPALQSTVLPSQHSFEKQSPGKVAVRPTNDVITSLPPSNVASSTPVVQSAAAANLATSSVLATSVAATLAPDQADPPRSSNQDWSDRFIQLQAFLRNNEQSGKEEYIRSKQSTGKIAAQPTNDLTTSPPPRNVMFSTTVLQSSVAANLAPRGVSANNTASRAAISAANLVSSSVSPTNTASTDAISATTQAPNRAHPPRSSNQDRSDRFLRLQAFLRNNEQSGQEEYIRMLRSLSSVGRSKHAIELEKRAANLLIEEGKELQKMKVLNVLGKLSPTDAPSAQPATVKHLPFPAQR